MFGSVVLEVTLGLFFVYAWFSLACSAVVEFLESLRAQRGKQLATAVERMLGPELKARFYQHGVVRSLSKGRRLPSYVPARSFATVTLDLLGVSAAQFRQQLEALSGDVATTLRTITKDATTYPEVVALVERWFEDSMDRCAGWFRRRTRFAALMTGLVLASLLNVDSLEIASAIYSDTHLRLSALGQGEAEGQVPVGRRLGGNTSVARRANDAGPNVMSIPVESGSLPLGWENSRFVTRAEWADDAWSRPGFWLGPVLMKVLGILVTALASSLGAVFWFDALCRVVAIRTSLAPCRNLVGMLPAQSSPSGSILPVLTPLAGTLLTDPTPKTLIGLEERGAVVSGGERPPVGVVVPPVRMDGGSRFANTSDERVEIDPIVNVGDNKSRPPA